MRGAFFGERLLGIRVELRALASHPALLDSLDLSGSFSTVPAGRMVCSQWVSRAKGFMEDAIVPS